MIPWNSPVKSTKVPQKAVVESFGIGPVRFSNEKLAAPFHSTKGPSSCFTFKQRTCSECKTVDAPSGGEAHPEQEPESLFLVLSNVTSYPEFS
jgi:hypothetical protein